MKTRFMVAIIGLFTLSACELGKEGDECHADNECADGLECHVEEHDHDHDHGAAAESDGEEGHDEAGVCEPKDEHDHDHDHE